MQKMSQDLLKVKVIFDFLSKKDLEIQSLKKDQGSVELKHKIELSNEDLFFLSDKIQQLQFCQDPFVQKLSQLSRVLKLTMTPTEWLSLLIPIERVLKKNPIDSDFIITSKDHQNQLRTTYPVRILLDSFRSAFNVGSLFRTSECLGVEHIYLCGYTPTPEAEKVHKSAMGTEKQVNWSYHEKTQDLILQLKNDFQIIALETSPQALEIKKCFLRRPTVFILGNERFGLDPSLLNLCNEVRKIPLVGTKNSLNASTCGALAIYEWTSQWNS